MNSENILLINELKPYINNFTLQCIIIRYIDDPTDKIDNLIKYHYKVADCSGSVILCIPHVLIQEKLNENKVDHFLSNDIDDYIVDSCDFLDINYNENCNEINGNNTYNINNDSNTNNNNNSINILNNKNEYNNNLINMKNDKNIVNTTINTNNINNDNIINVKNRNNLITNSYENNIGTNKSLKYFFQIGDIIKIEGAHTTWSMGRMVVMPSLRLNKLKGNEKIGSIYKIGFFNMEIKLKPNISNLITGTIENKYKEENTLDKYDFNKYNVNKKKKFNLYNKKNNKYDIISLISDDEIM